MGKADILTGNFFNNKHVILSVYSFDVLKVFINHTSQMLLIPLSNTFIEYSSNTLMLWEKCTFSLYSYLDATTDIVMCYKSVS